MNNEEPKLLPPYEVRPYSLVMSQKVEKVEALAFSKYLAGLVKKHARTPVRKVLELCPSEDQSNSVALRKLGFEVATIVVGSETQAVGRSKDGKRRYVVGEALHFPEETVRGKPFDAAVLTLGCFSQATLQEEVRDLLVNVRSLLTTEGLVVVEAWHLGGVDPRATEPQGSKDWRQLERDGVTMTVLTHSFLDLPRSLLDVEVTHILKKAQDDWTQYKETYVWRVYSLRELADLFDGAGLEEQAFYKLNSFDPPSVDTLRVSCVCLNKQS